MGGRGQEKGRVPHSTPRLMHKDVWLLQLLERRKGREGETKTKLFDSVHDLVGLRQFANDWQLPKKIDSPIAPRRDSVVSVNTRSLTLSLLIVTVMAIPSESSRCPLITRSPFPLSSHHYRPACSVSPSPPPPPPSFY